MEILALIAAALVVTGPPALAAMFWLRARQAPVDAIQLAAVGFGGLGIAALALWLAAALVGLSPASVAIAPLIGAALLALPAALGARRPDRRRPGARPGRLAGDYDGRVVPEAGRTPAPEGPARTAMKRAPAGHFAALAAAACVFALLVWLPFLSYGMQRADGVHRMAMTDWYKHLMVTTALGAADAFPPPNPFLHAAPAAPYYYGFHLVAAAIATLRDPIAGALGAAPAGDPVFDALLLLTLLTAAATPFVAYSAARSIAAGRGSDVGDTASVPLLAALGATLLAGFDLVPLLIDTVRNAMGAGPWRGGLAWLRAVIPSTHLDYWIHHNERQFNAPYVATIWAPQHVAAALTALLVVHLVVRRARLAETQPARARLGAPWLLPAMLLAAVPALSAYVGLGLAAGVGGAILFESLRGRSLAWQTAAWRTWLVPGVAAIALALPVLTVLASGAAGGLLLHVSAAGSWTNGAFFSWWLGPGSWSNLVDSFALYVVELGVVGVLALLEIRRRAGKDRILPHQAQVIAMVATIMLLVTVVRPPLDGPNNLYARPMILVWFLLAPFAAMRFARLSGRVKKTGDAIADERMAAARARRVPAVGNARWAIAATGLCLLANGYAVVGALLEGGLFWAAPPAIVEASRWINENTDPGAVVVVGPADLDSALGYWLRRPLLLADERHALLFGADPEAYEETQRALRSALASATPAEAAARFAAAGAGASFVVLLGEKGRSSAPAPRRREGEAAAPPAGEAVAPPAGVAVAPPAGVAAAPSAGETAALPSGEATPWVAPPCFEVVHREGPWWVVAPRVPGC